MTSARWRIGILVLAILAAASTHDSAVPQQVNTSRLSRAVTESTPFQRLMWNYEQRAFPGDSIPLGARELGMAQIQQQAQRAQVSLALRWESLGPTPINMTAPNSGRVAEVTVDPGDNNHWLIGAAQGGIWETTDGGTTWMPLTDDKASLAMGAIAFAPSNTNIIYAGTGEAANSSDAYGGAGLLKSTDGGATWNLMASGAFTGGDFSDIHVDPTNPNIVVAATGRGIAGFLGTGGFPGTPMTGIVKSANGGVDWVSKLAGTASDLEVSSSDFNNQYAALGSTSAAASNGVYRSTNAGDNWTKISGPWDSAIGVTVGRIELAMSPSSPGTLYVSIADSSTSGVLGLWKATNAFAATPTWSSVSLTGAGTNGYCSPQCWYDHEIIVDPANANTIYAGGVQLYKYASSSWSQISSGNSVHVDQHAMAWAGSRLVVGNDGGVYSTADSGATFDNHNQNLTITQFYHGSIHPDDRDFVMGGTQDNGTLLRQVSDIWTRVFGGDGADTDMSRTNPTQDWMVSWQRMNILRTTNGGSDYSYVMNGLDTSGAAFIATVEMCPGNADILIAGSNNLWRVTDFFTGGAPTWASNGTEEGTSILGMAFASADSLCRTYGYGTNSGTLKVTTNAGVGWTNVDGSNRVPDRTVTDIAFDPTNASIMYVTLSGFDSGTPGQSGHVFKTANATSGGGSWSNISPPVDMPFSAIAVHPGNGNLLAAASDLGVWMSRDGGRTWQHQGPGSGLPNVAVYDVQFNRSAAFAYTHGRGVFRASVSSLELFIGDN